MGFEQAYKSDSALCAQDRNGCEVSARKCIMERIIVGGVARTIFCGCVGGVCGLLRSIVIRTLLPFRGKPS